MSKWCGVLKGGGMLLVAAGVGLWLASAALVSGQETAQLTVSPVSQNVALGGDMFMVDVKIANVSNVGAYELTMTFDPDVLEYAGIAESEFIFSTGRSVNCVGSGTSLTTVNQRGAFNLTCSSNGLIEQNDGIAGPNANGATTIATIALKPKAVGVSDLWFRSADPNDPPYLLSDTQGGRTQLDAVEVCEGDPQSDDYCETTDIDLEVQNGIVKVFDPNAATPTGVPATPTKVPPAPERDIQATVAAVLGTPGRRLTPVAGSSGDTTSGTLGGTRGGRGNLPAGQISGSGTNAGATGPDGAPVAGYGPQSSDLATWPQVVGVALALAGVAAIGTGAAVRRRVE